MVIDMQMTKRQRDWFFLQQQRKRRRANSTPLAVQRYIRTLDGETHYGEFAEPITFAEGEDFEIEFKIVLDDPSYTLRVLGGSDTSDEIGIDYPNNRVRFVADGNFSTFSNVLTGVEHSNINHYRLVRTSGSLSLFINGVKLGGNQSSIQAASFQFIGRFLSFYWDGVIFDLKIWRNGTSETGQLTHYDLKGNKPYELPEGEELGEELYQISDIALGSGWSVEDTDLVYSGVGTDLVTINTSLVVGDHYEIIVRASSGTFRERYDRVNFVGGTESRRVLSYTGGTLQLQGNNEPCRISLISTKQLPPSTLIWRNNPPAVKVTQDNVSGDWKDANGIVYPLSDYLAAKHK